MDKKEQDLIMEIEALEGEERCLKADLSASTSEIGDWKEIKQLETQAYTDEEMKAYREKRAAARKRINEIEAEVLKLKQKLINE